MVPSEQPAASPRAPLAWLVPVAIILAHIAVFPRRVNLDCGMFLAAGRMILEGKRPFIDIIDTNPPLIMYLSAIPAALERVLPLHTTTIFSLLATAACAASAASLLSLLRRPETGLSGAEAGFAALLWTTLALAIDVNRSLGQRDHLFVLAYFPYLILRWLRWHGGGAGAAHAAALGLAAGTTACLRPFFVALLLAPEAYGLLLRRSARGALVRPETAAAVLAGAAYGAYFLLLPEDAHEAIFSRWGPLVTRSYDVWDHPFRMIMRSRLIAFPLAAGAAALLPPVIARARGLSAGADPPWRSLARLAAVVTLVCTAHFVLARKYWPYRAHPAEAGATLVLALLVGPAILRASWSGLRRRLALAATLAVPLLLWKGDLPAVGIRDPGLDDEIETVVLERSRPGDALLFVTTHVLPTHPLTVQLDRRPATRFLTLFPIGFAYRGVTSPEGGPFPYHRAGALPPEEARALAELRSDLERSRPALIFIPKDDVPLPTLPRGFVMREYLEAVGLLPGLLEGYRFLGEFNGFRAYARAP